jgi:hypothetical protein
MDFKNPREQAKYFLNAAKKAPAAFHAELEDQGRAIEGECKRLFGTYQDGWAQLADSTREQHEKQGFAPNDPLFRSGGLQGAVTHKLEGHSVSEQVFIGVPEGVMLTEPNGREVDAATVMAAQEYGTDDGRIPPRPVFGTVEKDMGLKARMGL